jgi:hypothetical protein
VHWEKVIHDWQGEMALRPEKVNLYGAVAYLLSRRGMETVLRHPFLSNGALLQEAPRLQMDVTRMPLYPCVVVDDCILTPLLGAQSYIASPPLLTFSDGIVLAKASTVRTDVKQLHYESRWFSLDWAALHSGRPAPLVTTSATLPRAWHASERRVRARPAERPGAWPAAVRPRYANVNRGTCTVICRVAG